eukprot:TRINITY_DN107019_c0_g1_i1.p1 TRINITY_DN107019_c0_g1~~TRINITY_DN107019_c0_g1_i1.p1  ORF type:complete len:198 (-),score=38.56 TRINITY_DN107019_c0_g1_i1:200-793(-)
MAMDLKIIVRNTFLDVDETEEHDEGSCRKRSSSVPCKFKPRFTSWQSPYAKGLPSPSIASTAASTSASDGEASDIGSPADSNTPRDAEDSLERKGKSSTAGGVPPYSLPAPAMPVRAELNPDAVEFKMPTQSPVGWSPMCMPATPPVGDTAQIPWLNPNAYTFQPGAAAFSPSASPSMMVSGSPGFDFENFSHGPAS